MLLMSSPKPCRAVFGLDGGPKSTTIAPIYTVQCSMKPVNGRDHEHGEEREALFARQKQAPAEVELRPEVWAALRQLSVRQRAVIVLTYWEDLTPAQSAARLGFERGGGSAPPGTRQGASTKGVER